MTRAGQVGDIRVMMLSAVSGVFHAGAAIVGARTAAGAITGKTGKGLGAVLVKIGIKLSPLKLGIIVVGVGLITSAIERAARRRERNRIRLALKYGIWGTHSRSRLLPNDRFGPWWPTLAEDRNIADEDLPIVVSQRILPENAVETLMRLTVNGRSDAIMETLSRNMHIIGVATQNPGITVAVGQNNDPAFRDLSTVANHTVRVSGLHHFPAIESVTIRLLTVPPRRNRDSEPIEIYKQKYSYDPKSGEDLLSVFPLLHGVARNETITDMRGTIWAERLDIVFVDGNGLSAQVRRGLSSPRYAVLAGARQMGARRFVADIEYAEDSGLLPLHIEHDFHWHIRIDIQPLPEGAF